MSSSQQSVRARQAVALERMFNLNTPIEDAAPGSSLDRASSGSWKVLIYDSYCRDVISVLFHVADLRKHGITLHLNLESDRQPVPDTPAVYFVMPTEANISRICKDFERGLYDAYHLNFASTIPRPLLERLAEASVTFSTTTKIVKVFDQYSNFVSLERNLLSLGHRDSYIALNSPSATDTQIEATVDSIVAGVFSIFATQGVVPVLRCPRGDAAEMVATRLHKRIQDHLLNKNNLFAVANSASFQRPVLLILDRMVDMGIPLHHTWTYQALLSDILNLGLNKVTVQAKDSTRKTYDLVESDSFWVHNAGSEFPKVADEVENELTAYKRKAEAINKQTGADETDIPALDDTRSLVSAVESLPELTEKKRILDMHTSIASALLEAIKDRDLDNFYTVEEGLMTATASLDKPTLLGMLSPSSKGTPQDKLRLLLIFFLLSPTPVPDTDMEEYTAAVTALGADLSPVEKFKELKKLRSFNTMVSNSKAAASTQDSAAGSGWRANLTSKVTSTVGQAGMKGLGMLKNLVGKRQELPVTRLTDGVMECKQNAELDSYLYLDPKQMGDGGPAPKGRAPFTDAVVFLVGGGCYAEFQDLQDYARLPKHQTGPKNIVYASTELLSPADFLRQLGSCVVKRSA